MKTLVQFVLIVTLMFACKFEDVKTGNGQSASESQKRFPEAETAEIAASGIADPNYQEPIDPGSQGGGGGDITYVPPAAPVLFNAEPFVPAGRASAGYSSTGTWVRDIVAMGPASSDENFPAPLNTNMPKLWMGFMIYEGGYRYVVRGYPFVVGTGGIAGWVSSPINVQFVMGTANAVVENWVWQQAKYDNNGLLISSAHWTCTNCNGAMAVTQADVSVSELNVTPEGRLNLKATVKFGNKVFQINRTNFKRIAY